MRPAIARPRRQAKRLMSEGLDCFRLLFPKGMDANEYARAVKPAEKSLGVVIRSARWLGSGTKPKLTTHCLNSVHQWVESDEVLRTAHALPTASSPASQTAADKILQSTPVLQTEPIESVAPTSDATGVPSATPVPGAAPVLAAVPTATDPALTGHATATLPEPEAAAVPPLPPPEAEAKPDEQQLVIAFGERRYRVRGLPKQLGEALKVNVLVRLAPLTHLPRSACRGRAARRYVRSVPGEGAGSVRQAGLDRAASRGECDPTRSRAAAAQTRAGDR